MTSTTTRFPLAREQEVPLQLALERVTPGARSELFATARAGRSVRLFPGVYVDAIRWGTLSGDDRHLLRIDAASRRSRSHLVFSHLSAAVLWRLPAVAAWPERVHVVQPTWAATRSNSMLIRHSTGIPSDLECIDGRMVTSLAQTVTDVAALVAFRDAVVFADAALRRTDHPHPSLPRTGVTLDELTGLAASRSARRGRALALRAVGFADGRADRPGESISRVSMLETGITAPELQSEVFGASGMRYFADFFWPSRRHLGEFDGAAKYEDPAFLRGRTPHRALMDEKRREDDLRAAGYTFSRWGWDAALSPPRLGALLRNAGI